MNNEKIMKNRFFTILFVCSVGVFCLMLLSTVLVKGQNSLMVSQSVVSELPSCMSNMVNKVYLPLANSSENSDSQSTTQDAVLVVCADIQSPVEGLVLEGIDNQVITVKGNVQPVNSGLQVKVRDISIATIVVDGNTIDISTVDGTIDQAGNFSVPNILLDDKENHLTVEFYKEGKLIGKKELKVTWVAPAAASAQITPEQGGTAEVKDVASGVLGAAVTIPPGSAPRAFRVLINKAQSEADSEVPNLPYGFVAVGPAVNFFNNTRETFIIPATIKIFSFR